MNVFFRIYVCILQTYNVILTREREKKNIHITLVFDHKNLFCK
jgi:hypothetical protein